jgi:hypothetical protein
MIYTHVLNRGPAGVRSRWTGCSIDEDVDTLLVHVHATLTGRAV